MTLALALTQYGMLSRRSPTEQPQYKSLSRTLTGCCKCDYDPDIAGPSITQVLIQTDKTESPGTIKNY